MSGKANAPLLDIVTHLEAERLMGLPKSWFETTAESAEVAPPVDLTLVPVKSVYSDKNLSELEAIAKGCNKCPLCEGRNKVVFGIGKTDKPLFCFVGEGPGADEDRLGEPFVGRAGQLLTAAITKGMGLKREDVYIANVVKCRPPQNRTPLPNEVEACTPYLYRQLEIIQPRVIITLGQPAQLALSGVKMGITKLRGKWLNWRGFKLIPTFHPAYLLRNPPAKKEFWEDLQTAMLEVGLKAPAKEL